MKLLSHQLGMIITKRMYKKAYTQFRKSPSTQGQENETTYIAFRTDYLNLVVKLNLQSEKIQNAKLDNIKEGV